MTNIVPFLTNIRFSALGINRDGRIIVKVLNTQQQFLRYAEELLGTPELINYFSKNQVSWICDVARINRYKTFNNLNKSSH